MLSHICRNRIGDINGQSDHIQRIQNSLGDIARHDETQVHAELDNALHELDLPKLQQCEVRTLEDAINFDKLVGWPIILKTAFSVNGQGVHYCNSKSEIESIYNSLPPYKRDPLIAQEYCDGEVIRHSIDSHHGEAAGSVTGIQLHTRDNNPTRVATALRITQIPEIEAMTKQLASYWKLSGFSGFD